jgi:hypothetical protein
MVHTCALGKPARRNSVDGTIVCWGSGFASENDAPEGVFKLH